MLLVFCIHFLIYDYQLHDPNQARLSILDCNTMFSPSDLTENPEILSIIKRVKYISCSKYKSLHLYLNSFESKEKIPQIYLIVNIRRKCTSTKLLQDHLVSNPFSDFERVLTYIWIRKDAFNSIFGTFFKPQYQFYKSLANLHINTRIYYSEKS